MLIGELTWLEPEEARPRPSRTQLLRPLLASRFALVGVSGLVVNQALLWLAVAVGGGPRRRPLVTHGPKFVAYEEHLGAAAANFRLDFGDRIEVTVGPLLARSPHVVYTNVVEALLRFVLVSRDHILLHSATVQLGSRGVMLTARTDTGKTGTVLRLLRDHEGAFLSDDMTIVAPSGLALGYPKPLTISSHTLAAVNLAALSPGEQLKLALQSRVHSKGGRAIGSRLGELNLPIMALNAVAQAVGPPPKYMIDRLVPCRFAPSTTVHELFVIERGPLALEELDGEQAAEIMLHNTDDAYGFPPFRYFAYRAGAEVVLNGHDHDYERFAPQAPDGRADPRRGIRAFVVGTGGVNLRQFGAVQPNSEARHNAGFGVLLLELRPGGYGWRFASAGGGSFSDSGSGACH